MRATKKTTDATSLCLTRDFMGCFRHGLAFVPNYLKALQPSCVRFASQLKRAGQTFHQLDASLPFPGLGLSKPVRSGLKSAFPTVTTATAAQATLIPAIIQGKDVMIKGHTGSGKWVGSWSSFGFTMLMTADLSG